MLTRQYKDVWFGYSPKTGQLYRKLRVARTGYKVGDWAPIAINSGKNGYPVVGVAEETILLHRLAVFIKTGSWPSGHVDHLNWVRTDNRWKNLRVVTQQENNYRMRPCAKKRSRFKGVSKSYSSASWIAQISVKGRMVHLGSFKTEEAAAQAFDKAAVKLRGPKALTNKELGLYGS